MNALAVAPPALLLIAGFIVCFFGYRLLRFALVLAGFGAGLALGFAVARLIPGTNQVVALVIGIVCGVLGAVISTLLYKVGVFILGAVAGVLVAGIIMSATGWHQPLLVCAVAALGCGILTCLLEQPLVSVLTAFAGAWGIIAGSCQLLTWYHVTAIAGKHPANCGYMVIAWIVVGAVGSLAQFSRGRTRRDTRVPTPHPASPPKEEE